MSLKVWIPFTDGTAKNQGTSNLTFTNSNSSKTYSSDTGKLGKCFYNNAYYNGAGLISNETITLPVTLSWFCWAKFDSFGSSASLNGVVTNHDYVNKKNMGITILYVSSTTGKLSCNTGTGSGRTYNTYTGSTVLNTGTWYHIGFTYDGSNIKFYVNGVLDGTTAYTGLSLGAAKIGIFRWDAMTENTYNMHGSLNDIRIYDHCLTPQEVKEISKGLVIHYTLGSESVLPAITNYCSNSGAGGWNNSGAASRSGNDTTKGSPLGQPVYSITTTTAGEQCITFGNPDVTNLKGKQVTASCWIYIVGSTIYNSAPYLRSSKYDNVIASFKYEGNGSINTWPKNKWIRVSGTGTVASDETRAYFCNYIGNSGEVRYYTGWQVELYGEATPYIAPGTSRSPGIIYDSSGYCRNGTISGTLIPNSDTSRYKNCVRVTGTGKIVYPFPNLLQFTFSLWFKRDRVSLSNREMLGTGWYGLSMELNSDNTLTMRHYLTSGTWNVISTTKFSDTSKWYHIALTRNASGISKIYVNGVEDKSGTNTNAINYTASTAELFTYADSYLFRGSMSDFRIYATALSADDIGDLYKLGASIS